MAETGWAYPSSATQLQFGLGSTGSIWNNIGNIAGEDNTVGRVSMSSSFSRVAYVGQFGFDLPTGAVITGISARVKARRPTGSPVLSAVYAFKNTGSGDVSTTLDASTIASNVTLQWIEAVSTPNLFNQTWTEAEIESSTFGLGFCFRSASGTGSVDMDSAQAKITYDEPATGGFFFGIVPWLVGLASFGGLSSALARQRARELVNGRASALIT